MNHPYSESSSNSLLMTGGSARQAYLNTGVGSQNVMASGNTINNNFNIVNNITQINSDKA
jgi:hypothetical protein